MPYLTRKKKRRPMKQSRIAFRYRLSKTLKIQRSLLVSQKYLILKPNTQKTSYVCLVQSKGRVEDEESESKSNVLKVLTVILSPTQINLNWISKKSLVTMKTAAKCLPDVQLTYGKNKSLNLLKKKKKNNVEMPKPKILTKKLHLSSIKNKDDRFQCSFCPKSYKSQTGLQYHLSIHTGDRLMCRFCDKKFIQHTPRKKHEKECHGEVIKTSINNLFIIYYYFPGTQTFHKRENRSQEVTSPKDALTK